MSLDPPSSTKKPNPIPPWPNWKNIKHHDGSFNFITRSGVEVPVGIINTVKPSEAVATPNPVKAQP